MLWGSVTVQKIDLEEKNVYTPNPVIQDHFFSLPTVAVSPVQNTVMTSPVVIPPVATTDENMEPVRPVPQEPEEPVAAHGGSNNSPK
jgi:hypothetical protein